MPVIIDVIQVWDTSGRSNKQTDLGWPVLFYSKLFLRLRVYVLSSNFILFPPILLIVDNRVQIVHDICVVMTRK